MMAEEFVTLKKWMLELRKQTDSRMAKSLSFPLKWLIKDEQRGKGMRKRAEGETIVLPFLTMCP